MLQGSVVSTLKDGTKWVAPVAGQSGVTTTASSALTRTADGASPRRHGGTPVGSLRPVCQHGCRRRSPTGRRSRGRPWGSLPHKGARKFSDRRQDPREARVPFRGHQRHPACILCPPSSARQTCHRRRSAGERKGCSCRHSESACGTGARGTRRRKRPGRAGRTTWCCAMLAVRSVRGAWRVRPRSTLVTAVAAPRFTPPEGSSGSRSIRQRGAGAASGTMPARGNPRDFMRGATAARSGTAGALFLHAWRRSGSLAHPARRG